MTRQNADEPASVRDGRPPTLRLTGLHKAFGDNVAVRHLDLTVPQGSFFGLVGPNSAGKTTALSMAVGLLRPDYGHSEVLGVDVWSDPVQAKALLGVLPDGLSMPERLTGREVLTFIGQLRGIEPDVLTGRVDELLDIMQLTDAERTLVVDYSTGMRKKIGLATAPAAPTPAAWYSTSRSKGSTRSPPPRSRRSWCASSPPAGRPSCPATSWRWSSSCATRSPS